MWVTLLGLTLDVVGAFLLIWGALKGDAGRLIASTRSIRLNWKDNLYTK